MKNATNDIQIRVMTATIIENGNGFPNIGEMVYDASTDTIYRITGWDGSDRISTNGPGRGNSVCVIVDGIGSASDLSDEELEIIESNNYGILLAN